MIGTPVGHLGDITLRALAVLRKEVEIIFCEDTRRTVKLLNAYEIKKPLRSCPAFREKKMVVDILDCLAKEQKIAYVSDAGIPNLNDPGAELVRSAREAGYRVDVVGGVKALTYFIAGLGVAMTTFRFVGFLPPRRKDREKLFNMDILEPVIFFESPHRLDSTLELLIHQKPDFRVIFAKELSKINEAFFLGKPEDIKKQIQSFRGEWIGCIFPHQNKRREYFNAFVRNIIFK